MLKIIFFSQIEARTSTEPGISQRYECQWQESHWLAMWWLSVVCTEHGVPHIGHLFPGILLRVATSPRVSREVGDGVGGWWSKGVWPSLLSIIFTRNAVAPNSDVPTSTKAWGCTNAKSHLLPSGTSKTLASESRGLPWHPERAARLPSAFLSHSERCRSER